VARAATPQAGRHASTIDRQMESRSVGAILKGIMSQKVTVSEGGRMRRVSRIELMLLGFVNDAARGDPHATKLALEVNDRYSQPIDGDAQSVELSADDLEILAAYSTQGLDPYTVKVRTRQKWRAATAIASEARVLCVLLWHEFERLRA
jgi:hypothetical protein